MLTNYYYHEIASLMNCRQRYLKKYMLELLDILYGVFIYNYELSHGFTVIGDLFFFGGGGVGFKTIKIALLPFDCL